MVVEYLEKIKSRCQEKGIDARNRLKSLSNEYKENIEFIKLLDANNDPNFESFTPRQVNGFNRSKILELEEKQKDLAILIDEVSAEISALDNEIYEINSVLKVAKENALSDTGEGGSSKLVLLEIQEKERQRIARELHDSTVQNLISIVHKTELCSKLLDADPIRCKLELSYMGKLIRDVIDDTRNLIYDLRPMSFDDIGFEITVERFVDKIKLMTGANVSFGMEGQPYPINAVIGITLLRIIQEACNNAIKHSNASSIRVRLIYEEESLVVEIADDGDGFVVDNVMNVSREDNSGFGLSMMKERIFLLSGELEIYSKPGAGCRVRAYIPIDEEEK